MFTLPYNAPLLDRGGSIKNSYASTIAVNAADASEK
jgi:hypothetical protein